MDLEWDERKHRTNIVKHGIDFVGAAKIFDGPVMETEDRRRDYGEVRYQVLGKVGSEVIYLVYTWRGRRRRIISARKAGRDEKEIYYASIEGSVGGND